MSSTACLKLADTYLFVKNDVCMRYEIYVDAKISHINVAMIMIIQEDENDRNIVEKNFIPATNQSGSGFQQKVSATMNPGPLQIATAESFCTTHFTQHYGK